MMKKRLKLNFPLKEKAGVPGVQKILILPG
jgi:hypothetical protein